MDTDKITSGDVLALIRSIEGKAQEAIPDDFAVPGYYQAYASLRIAEALDALLDYDDTDARVGSRRR